MEARIATCFIILFVTLSGAAPASTWSVPGDFPIIQAAIDAALTGDVILVEPGTYTENLDFLGKAIEVRSTQGPEITIIDGDQNGTVVTFQSGEGRDSVLEGFTIQGGTGTVLPTDPAPVGGGLLILDGASPSILNNVIQNNDLGAPAYGGGVFCYPHGDPWIQGNVIRNNRAGDYPGGSGGGLYFQGGAPEILGNTIESNYSVSAGGIMLYESAALIEGNVIIGNSAGWGAGGGIYCLGDPAPVIRGNSILSNSCWEVIAPYSALGGGIWCGASALIERNTIIDNEADWAGGGIACSWYGHPIIRCNVMARNRAGAWYPWGTGGGLYVSSSVFGATIEGNTVVSNEVSQSGGGIANDKSGVEVRGSIVWGNQSNGQPDQIQSLGPVSWSDVEGGWSGPGVGNIDTEPRFRDPTVDDYCLQLGSPCIDAWDPGATQVGKDLYGYPRSLDGRLDRIMAADMGAQEYCHVDLQVTGDATPGGDLTFETTGTPQLLAFLFIGVGTGENWLRPYGALFMTDLFVFYPFAVIPDTRVVTVPSSLPTPSTFIVQELAIHYFNRNGNFSNPVTIRVE